MLFRVERIVSLIWNDWGVLSLHELAWRFLDALNLEMVTTAKGFQNSLTLPELLEKVEQKAHCHNHDQSISNDDLSKIKTTLSCMNTLLIIWF